MELSAEQRIVRLERRMRRQQWGLLVLGVALGAVLTLGASNNAPVVEVLRTHRLEVVDAAGTPVAVMGTYENGGGLSVLNTAGKTVAEVAAKENGGGLGVANTAGKTVAEVMAKEDGGWLGVLNKTGEEVVQAYADEYGHGFVGVWDRQGKGRTLTPR